MDNHLGSHINSVMFYISTGGNSIMYTLRRVTLLKDGREADRYVKNLSTDEDKAISIAKDYIAKFDKLVKDVFLVIFDEHVRQTPQLEWGEGKLTPSDIYKIKSLLNGVILFGKHHGKSLKEIPNDYLCWVCNSYKKNALKDSSNKVSEIFSNIALSELIDRGFIESYEQLETYLGELQDKKHQVELLSDHIGDVKKRLELTDLQIEYCRSEWDYTYNQKRYFYKLKKDKDILTYSGTIDLGEEKSKISIKATIKDHKYYNNIKTTVLSRPVIL